MLFLIAQRITVLVGMEKDASKTMSFLNKIPEWEHSAILVPGAGTSVLIEALLSKRAHLVLNDISQEALNKLKKIKIQEVNRGHILYALYKRATDRIG